MGSPEFPPADEEPAVSRLRVELAASQAALREAAAERQGWEQALKEASGRERQRLAKTLHDSLSQSLTGMYFQAQVVIKKTERCCPEEVQDIIELAGMIHQSVVELADLTRALQTPEPHPPTAT